MKRISQAGQDRLRTSARAGEAAQLRGHDGEAMFPYVGGGPCLAGQLMLAQPNLMELHAVGIAPIDSKGMDIAVPGPRPIDELDAQLEGRLGRPNERILIDPQ